MGVATFVPWLSHCYDRKFVVNTYKFSKEGAAEKSWNGKLLQLPYNIITTCLVCERVRKKERQIFNHELHKRKVGKWY